VYKTQLNIICYNTEMMHLITLSLINMHNLRNEFSNDINISVIIDFFHIVYNVFSLNISSIFIFILFFENESGF